MTLWKQFLPYTWTPPSVDQSAGDGWQTYITSLHMQLESAKLKHTGMKQEFRGRLYAPVLEMSSKTRKKKDVSGIMYKRKLYSWAQKLCVSRR